MGFGKDGKLSILYEFSRNIDVSALAALDVIATGGGYHNTLIDDFRMISLKYQAYFEGGEVGDSLVFGIASSDLSAPEIELALETAWVEEDNRISEESSGRPVWVLGRLAVLAAEGSVPFEGEFRKEVIRWTFHQQSGWQWWCYNPSTGSAIGSTATFSPMAKIYGVWVR